VRSTGKIVRPEPHRVVVVGGGASGALVAAHLLRLARPERPLEERIVERAEVIGPGLAYGEAEPYHLLNNAANRMSAFPSDPDHLLRWCATHGIKAEQGSFLPRRTYGRYLSSLAGEVVETSWRRRVSVRGEAVEIAARDDPHPRSANVEVDLSDGRPQLAHSVVLAVGNPPPRPLVRLPARVTWPIRGCRERST